MRLFDEYAASFARGERPDARAYLARAGEKGDELAALIERYLKRVPPPAPDADTVALAESWLAGQPPLLELRTRRGLRRDDVVDALVKRLDLDRAKRAKVKRYYDELEGGLLEPKRVDRRVWDVLASTLRARMDDLLAWRTDPPEAAFDALYRVTQADAVVAPSLAASTPPPRREEPDKIDRLFLGDGSPR
jgi:hypothetical protein